MRTLFEIESKCDCTDELTKIYMESVVVYVTVCYRTH
jgi:hypothetical protein